MTVKETVLVELAKVADENKQVPYRTLANIAKKHSFLYKYVQAIAKENGYHSEIYKAAPKLCYRCICGKIQKSKELCWPCRWVELPCESCEKPVRKRASRIVWELRNTYSRTDQNMPGWSGKVFCNKQCHGRYVGLSNKKVSN